MGKRQINRKNTPIDHQQDQNNKIKKINVQPKSKIITETDIQQHLISIQQTERQNQEVPSNSHLILVQAIIPQSSKVGKATFNNINQHKKYVQKVWLRGVVQANLLLRSQQNQVEANRDPYILYARQKDTHNKMQAEGPQKFRKKTIQKVNSMIYQQDEVLELSSFHQAQVCDAINTQQRSQNGKSWDSSSIFSDFQLLNKSKRKSRVKF